MKAAPVTLAGRRNLNENVMVPHGETHTGTITLSSQPSSPSREMMQRHFILPVFGLTAEWSILAAFRNHNLNNGIAGTFRAGVALKQQLDSLISLVR